MKTVDEHELWKVNRFPTSPPFTGMDLRASPQRPLISSLQLVSTYPMLNSITIYGTLMCPEYGVYHTRHPHDDRGFNSKEVDQLIPSVDLTKVRRSHD